MGKAVEEVGWLRFEVCDPKNPAGQMKVSHWFEEEKGDWENSLEPSLQLSPSSSFPHKRIPGVEVARPEELLDKPAQPNQPSKEK